MVPLSNNRTVLQELTRKFYKGSLDLESEAKEINTLTWCQQEEFLSDTVNNFLTKKYPIKSDFIKLFFKKLIKYLEEGQQEVHDDLYKKMCITMSSNKDDTFYYRHYIINDDLVNRIIIKETNNLVINGTTGMRTWEASLMLVDWALNNKEVFKDKHVLELGSGVGFTGITIAKYCQPASVVMSDCHADVLKTVEENIIINFTDLKQQAISYGSHFINKDNNIGVLNFDWINLSNVSLEICPDIIVGADIVYDPTLLEPLLKTLALFLDRNRNVEIFIAGVIRNQETFETFLRKIEATSLHKENVCHDKNVFIEWNRHMNMYLIKVKL